MDIGYYESVTLLLVSIVLLIVLSIVFVSWRNGISPMPTSLKVRQVVGEEVKRLYGWNSGLIVEAGSGWGTLGIHVAKQCRNCKVVGIENSPIPLWVSQLLAWLTFGVHPKQSSASSTYSSVTFRKGNIYTYPYANADLVICYLYPGAMKRLSPIFHEQLAPGAQIISVCFALPDWEPEKVITCKDFYRTQVYVYTVK
ncbi:class I SAM-dependent methyltransferase [Cohnella sp. WQ 127256]|uniref:class I SAM-dependent methyltransferase n=1 Tax=Cohnella sp. WQ 127256 TaxID=2938790 RepID=UPI00211779BB|nr:class I SAM-dependent methyltransferase [Cohnella sp. WQ 127256]